MNRGPLTAGDLERGRILGALLREARGARPVQDTAHAAGISPETLRKIESGRVATPAFSTVAAVADVLGISLDTAWAEVRRASSWSPHPAEPERADDASSARSAPG